MCIQERWGARLDGPEHHPSRVVSTRDLSRGFKS
jgi:hypothetical protein